MMSSTPSNEGIKGVTHIYPKGDIPNQRAVISGVHNASTAILEHEYLHLWIKNHVEEDRLGHVLCPHVECLSMGGGALDYAGVPEAFERGGY